MESYIDNDVEIKSFIEYTEALERDIERLRQENEKLQNIINKQAINNKKGDNNE